MNALEEKGHMWYLDTWKLKYWYHCDAICSLFVPLQIKNIYNIENIEKKSP